MLLLTGGIVAMALGWTDHERVYSLSVSQVVKGERYDETVRVSGELVAGSLCRVDDPCGYRFALGQVGPATETAGAPRPELRVRYDSCVVPDNFWDEPGVPVDVTVYGERCKTCRDFTATELAVRTTRAYALHGKGVRPAAYRAPLCAPRD